MSVHSFGQFFQEDSGRFSSSRLAFLLWIVGVLIAWFIASCKQAALQNIPDSVTIVIGILMTGKVSQKYLEKPAEESTAAPEPKS